MEKAVKSEIKLGLPFMVPNLVYKFQMICLWGTYVIKRQFWACPKLRPRFLMPYIMVFYLCLIGLRWKVIVHFVDIDGMVDPSLFKLSFHYLILILIRYCKPIKFRVQISFKTFVYITKYANVYCCEKYYKAFNIKRKILSLQITVHMRKNVNIISRENILVYSRIIDL